MDPTMRATKRQRTAHSEAVAIDRPYPNRPQQPIGATVRTIIQPKMDEFIRDGKVFYQSKDYVAALAAFSKALWFCRCDATLKWPPYGGLPKYSVSCRLKEDDLWVEMPLMATSDLSGRPTPLPQHPLGFELSRLDTNYMEELVSRQCDHSGRIHGKCRSASHMEALNGCSAAFLAMGDSGRALEYALAMISTDFSNPQAYLRTAKFICHARTATGSVSPSIPIFLARCIYQHGLKLVRKHGDMQDPNYKLLQRLAYQHARGDYVRGLPTELQEEILRQLSLRDLVHLSAVSRPWQRLLAGRPRLFETLVFEPGMTFSPAFLLPVLDGVRKLCIKDLGNFRLSPCGLTQLLQTPKDLRHVELRARISDLPHSISQWAYTCPIQAAFPCCTTLILENVAAAKPALLTQMLSCHMGSLQSLTVIGLPQASEYKIHGPLDSLKYVRLEGFPAPPAQRPGHMPLFELDTFNLRELLQTAPNLEQLYLDHLFLADWPRIPDWGESCGQNLRALVVGSGIGVDEAARVFPRLPRGMKMIDVLSTTWNVAAKLFNDGDVKKLNDLEYFRVRAPAGDYCMEAMDSTENLRLLDLNGGVEWWSRDLARVDRVHVVDEMAPDNLPNVRAVGMRSFMWPNTLSYVASHTGRPFVDWVGQFTNVDTVAAYPEPFDGCGEVIRELVQLDGIKTIYQNCLSGVVRDKVLAEAAKRGVTVIHTKNAWRPTIFPYPIDAGDGLPKQEDLKFLIDGFLG